MHNERQRKAESHGTRECLIPARDVWERYCITSRTLSRWLDRYELDFPRPLIVNGRRYFRLTEIEMWERIRARGPDRPENRLTARVSHPRAARGI